MTSVPGSSATVRRVSDAATRWGSRVFATLLVVVLLAPAVVIVVVSFSGDESFAFPPDTWGFRQYTTLFESETWSSAVVYSLKIAFPVVILSTLIAVPAALAIARSRLPGRHAFQALGLASIIIPISAYAVAMYGVFVQLHLLSTFVGLVIANTVLTFPLVLIVASAALSRIPVELELAAMTAGAGRVRAWWDITVRLLIPAILGGAVLAFITSFDEAVFINFLGGPDQVTLPKAIFSSVRYGLDPVITAIATLLIIATSALMLVAAYLRRIGQ